MVQSLALSSPSPIFDVRDSVSSRSSTVLCSSGNRTYNIPKREPFSRNKFDRILKDPPVIEKCKLDLMNYCSTLEGDASSSCWQAYLELNDLERVCRKEDLERLIIEVGGLKSLIGSLHGFASLHKRKKEEMESSKQLNEEKAAANAEKQRERPFHVPDGLPKSQEELEEEEKWRMPDSSFTVLLRKMGRFPAWYTPAPDHETD